MNANLSHYASAADALATAAPGRLGRLVTRRVPLADFADAFGSRPDDIEVALTLDR